MPDAPKDRPKPDSPATKTPEKPYSTPERTDRPAYSPGRGVDQDETDDEPAFNAARAAVTGGVILAALVALIFMATTSRPDVRPYRAGSLMAPAPAQAQTTTLDEDGTPVETTGTRPSARTARNVPALGDVIRVSVVAARDKLDPIRVTEEGDVRRPYWVEQGDSLQFTMRERFILENPAEGDGRLERVIVRVNGINFPTDRRDDRGRLLLTRDAVERYFDQLRRGG